MEKYIVQPYSQYLATYGVSAPEPEPATPIPVAVLSTTLLQEEGVYQYLPLPEAPTVAGCPHHVGHPDTRKILDGLGAIYTPGLFQGLQVNQAAYVARIENSRRGAASTTDQEARPEDIKWGMVIRLA